MTNQILTPEQAEEYRLLYEEFERAVERAGAILKRYGMESREFLEADGASNKLWVRLRELQGMAGEPWEA